MKSKLEFNLPDENEEFKDSCQGTLWKCLVSDIDQMLRDDIKYNPKNLSDDKLAYAESVREFIHNNMIEEGLTI